MPRVQKLWSSEEISTRAKAIATMGGLANDASYSDVEREVFREAGMRLLKDAPDRLKNLKAFF